ncbi:RNA-guided endonuclease TnpB family protein [Cyanobacterium aponinum UTEX 3222]|uniref:Transposase, IS605 OrfB family n=3 Tax=Cyanobacterium aponinum TaxID=379064 RepID=K9Z1B4_CYAAP|nr:RNA-guided endonuclease TnpB family protein [Cyanobacterium aponinum]WRL40449.1 RNA-guided endonuclease TnpB family protein [Cyanobacterium aponinum UTEX 3222]AFZ52522.1 transposase, IS605 OrfB family [Cyanobacterium aponinum PCC 10605]MBD2393156.1 IS200/IS605 family element transposase accessory protein TnpB [Cyanobacterium aponinum FACHB-4101]MTF37476.1 IS200/IS605 family element transposase accessory protein TnpB [Cyanobacterium aponinum 0216]WPF87314.1 RNA-guided endonuclease TnpB famil
MHRAIKVRIYPNKTQAKKLSQVMGCCRWWYNYALNLCIDTYKATGKALKQVALNKYLPKLKKEEDTAWLGDCYSQCLQSTTLNLTKAFKNFFEGRAKYPRYKSYQGRQSCQYPQNVSIVDGCLKIPQLGLVKAVIHRIFEGEIKTVTVSKTPTGKYYASILFDTKQTFPEVTITGKVCGIDLGIKDFAIVHDGRKTSKYANPRHIKKHEKNLARKQQKLARKKKGSKNREKARKLVAKVHERISNARQDFLHKLSRKIVNNNQVVVIEQLNIKGMVRNHNLAKAISDVGWGTLINFLDYKLKQKGGLLVEIDRWFPSSKTCSHCHYQMSEMPLEIREWTCPSCGSHHDRDENASKNIRAEGIRKIQTDGTAVSASGGSVRPKGGRKSVLRHEPVKDEAHTINL